MVVNDKMHKRALDLGCNTIPCDKFCEYARMENLWLMSNDDERIIWKT